jgi:hypothetical protein
MLYISFHLKEISEDMMGISVKISLCMCTVGTIYHKRTGSIKINMAEIKGCNSCIYQSTKNPPIDGVYFYPHTKASKFSTRKEWKRTACVRTLISSLERWCKTHYIISIDQAFISENFLQKRFRMCCTGQSILGIDKTFNLCDMHVTASCYKQTSVKMETIGEPPIFLGPIFIHDNSDFHNFTHFFHHLKIKLFGASTNQLAIGSDEEKDLVNAIKSTFPDSY